MDNLIISFLVIFFIRLLDTIFMTLTTMFMSQGNKKLAPILGAIQTATWVIGLNIVMKRLDNPLNLLVYALAYGCGIYAGILIEGKIAYGNVIVQAVIDEEQMHLIEELRNMDFRVTVIEGHGIENKRRLVLFIGLKRKHMPKVRSFLRENHVFMTISKGDMYMNIGAR